MVLLTIHNLGVKVDLQYLDISKGDQNTPEFVKVNPLHQVPVLHDEAQNFSLPESKAIMIYLATTIKSSFYPSEIKKRSLIDARLFFDASTTSPTIRNFTVNFEIWKIPKLIFLQRLILQARVKKMPEEVRESIKTLLSNIETLLTQSKYFAGDEVTLADFALLANVETIKVSSYQKLSHLVQ